MAREEEMATYIVKLPKLSYFTRDVDKSDFFYYRNPIICILFEMLNRWKPSQPSVRLSVRSAIYPSIHYLSLWKHFYWLYLILLFFFLSRCSRQVVCPIRKKMKFMVLDMVCLRHALDGPVFCINQQPPWTCITIPKITRNLRNSSLPHCPANISKSFILNSNTYHSNFSMYLLVSKGVCLDEIFFSFCYYSICVCCVSFCSYVQHVFRFSPIFCLCFCFWCFCLWHSICFVRSFVCLCVCFVCAFKVLRLFLLHHTYFSQLPLFLGHFSLSANPFICHDRSMYCICYICVYLFVSLILNLRLFIYLLFFVFNS